MVPSPTADQLRCLGCTTSALCALVQGVMSCLLGTPSCEQGSVHYWQVKRFWKPLLRRERPPSERNACPEAENWMWGWREPGP